MTQVPDQSSSARRIASRLPHPSGANVDEPRVDTLLRIAYEAGEWSIGRAEVDTGGEVIAQHMRPLPFEIAQQITDIVGMVTAEVVRRNHLMYAEALEIRAAVEHERAVAERQRALDDARALKEAMTP